MNNNLDDLMIVLSPLDIAYIGNIISGNSISQADVLVKNIMAIKWHKLSNILMIIKKENRLIIMAKILPIKFILFKISVISSYLELYILFNIFEINNPTKAPIKTLIRKSLPPYIIVKLVPVPRKKLLDIKYTK